MSGKHDSTSKVTVLLIDDHELVRSLVAAAIRETEGFEVCGEASNAERAVEIVRRTKPHVVVLDSMLPGQQGPEAVAGILRVSPCSRVLMFSGVTDPLALRRALGAGARGFVSKSAPFKELIEGIRSVHEGSIFGGAGSRRLVQRIIQDLPGSEPANPISTRERDVLSGIARGLSSKEIAAQLGLSIFTIENHRRRIMDRTGIHSIAGLTLLALEMGLVSRPGKGSTAGVLAAANQG
jgi:DNA-binding NarL/FixJ family response regulator